MQAAGMTLNKAKCEFSVKKIHFLGHVVIGRGNEVDPKKVKVKAVVNDRSQDLQSDFHECLPPGPI